MHRNRHTHSADAREAMVASDHGDPIQPASCIMRCLHKTPGNALVEPWDPFEDHRAALRLMLATLWLLMRGYHGLTGDAQLYAFQAFARIHPQLATDLYLQNTSQDQFTIFSPFYAGSSARWASRMRPACSRCCFTAWLLVASWSFARALAGRDAAWLGVAFLLIVAGDYGGSGVFRFSETIFDGSLSRRSLIVTALGCHLRGRKRWLCRWQWARCSSTR